MSFYRQGIGAFCLSLALLFNAAGAQGAPASPPGPPLGTTPFSTSPAGIEIRSISSGGFRLVGNQVGIPSLGLVPACDEDPSRLIVQSVGTIFADQGICADGSSEPCDGRLTFVVESCGSGRPVGSGAIYFEYRGPDFFALEAGRVCFDPTGNSTCDAPDADTQVVAQIGALPGIGSLSSFIGEAHGEATQSNRLTDIVPFTIDGREVVLDDKKYVTFVKWEQANGSCGFGGQRDCAQTYLSIHPEGN